MDMVTLMVLFRTSQLTRETLEPQISAKLMHVILILTQMLGHALLLPVNQTQGVSRNEGHISGRPVRPHRYRKPMPRTSVSQACG